MEILEVGDTRRAVCHHCKSFEQVTFQLRNTPFNDGSGIVKNVLAGVCDKRGTIAAIPHQSTTAIKLQLGVVSEEQAAENKARYAKWRKENMKEL